ncbi:MAG: hypothetical protein AAF901_03780 [Bacteroidota bacterium]
MTSKTLHITTNILRGLAFLLVVFALTLKPAISTFVLLGDFDLEVVDNMDSKTDSDEEDTNEEDKKDEKIEQQFLYSNSDSEGQPYLLTGSYENFHETLHQIEIPIPPPEQV